jgi:hypothetical protein
MHAVIPERPSAMGRLNAALTIAVVKWTVRRVAIRDGGAAFGFDVRICPRCEGREAAFRRPSTTTEAEANA